jgi:SNF2 family DNA or RNA helicase
MVVIDESSSFKNGTSKRFRAMKKVMKYIDRTVLLTGTPASNGYIDLWSQFYLLDMGARLGFTLTMFRNTYFTSDFMGYTYTLKDGAMQKIQEKIQDLVLSMDSKDYLELPENVPSVLTNKLSGKLLKQYNQFEKDALLAVGNEELSAVSAAVLTNKLLQFSGGAVYGEETEQGNKIVHHFHDLKFDTLDEIIEANPNENLLIAYNYKHELDRLIERYPYAVVMDGEGTAVKEWNEGKIKMLLVHPKSAGHGLNLQHGGSILVWFSFTWSLEEYQQLNKRLHRQGQKNVVRTIHIAVGDVEERLMRSISRKDMTQADLLKALE